MILGQLSHIALGVVDTIMVGKLGVTPLAAAALANSYFVLPLTFSYGLASAVAPLTAKYFASKRYLNLKSLLFNGFVVLLLTSIFFAAILFFGKTLLYYLNQPTQVIEAGWNYIDYLAYSTIPMALYLVFKNFSEGFEWMMPALWIGVISIPLNAFLNYLFIFGGLGFPNMGLDGAGLATFITRSLMLVAIILVIYKSKLKRFFDGEWYIHKAMIKKIADIGIPSGTQYVFEAGAFVMAAIMMGMIGEKTLAAHQIAINIASVPFMASIGLSAAASIRMGNIYGKRNILQIRHTGYNLMLLTLIFMILTTLILFFGRTLIPSYYTENQEVLEMASIMVIVAAVFQISDGLQAVTLGLLRGLEDVKYPTLITLTSYWIIAIPLAAFLAFYHDYGYLGIWLALLAGLSLSALLLFFRFRYIYSQLENKKSST